MSPTSKKTLFWMGGCFFFVIGAACGLIFLSLGIFSWQVVSPRLERSRPQEISGTAVVLENLPLATPTQVQMVGTPEGNPPADTTTVPPPTPVDPPPLGLELPPQIDQRPAGPQAWQNLTAMTSATYPARDFYDTEDRLGNRKLHGRENEAAPVEPGAERVIFLDQGEQLIRLLHVTDHALFWADVDLMIDPEDLVPVGQKLENELYGPLTRLLGMGLAPGIDGEPRVHIIHLSYRSADELGYFDSSDQFPRDIFKYSNEHDAIYLNMDELRLGERSYYGTMVHELEHLLHYHSDANEATWVDEGLAEFMEVYFDLNSFAVADYLSQPNIQLNAWSNEPQASYAHYSGAGLFFIYFWEQLGDQAIRDLFLHPADGLAGVQGVLASHRPGQTLEAFMSGFFAAVYLQDGHFRYWLPERPQRTILREPQEWAGQLPQFGVSYVELDLIGNVALTFAGDTRVELFDTSSTPSDQAWLAPAVNILDATLTSEVDLRGVDRATLVYQAWFELEPHLDFAYVLVSTNGGQSWQNLRPPQGIPGPFGRGYNGRSADRMPASSGWLAETVSLDSYVGQVVLIRFEVLTDGAEAGRGFAVNQIAVPEVGSDKMGPWMADGFVHTGSTLPQQWMVQILRPGLVPEVIQLPLDDYNQGRWRLELDQPVVLAIAPMTPMTAYPADYWVKVEKEE